MDADYFWRMLQADLQFVSTGEPLGAFRIQEAPKTHGKSHESWQGERDMIYGESLFDRVVPERVLGLVGMSAKALTLLRDERFEAFRSRETDFVGPE